MKRLRPGVPTLLGLIVGGCACAALWPLPLEQPRAVIALSELEPRAFSPDGNTLLLSDTTRTAIFDVRTGALRAEVVTEEIGVVCCFSADGTRWALPGASTVTVRDTGDGRVLETHPLPKKAVFFAFSSERRLLYLGWNNYVVRDLATKEIVFDLRPPKDLVRSVLSFERGLLFFIEWNSDLDADADVFAKTAWVTVYEMSTGRRLCMLPAGQHPWGGLAWGGRFLVTLGKDENAEETLYWLDMQTGELGKFKDQISPRLLPILSPDGQIVTKSEVWNPVPEFVTNWWPNLAMPHHEVSLIDVRSGRVLGSVPGLDPEFAPDGRTLAVYGPDGRTINLWDYPLPNWWWLRVSIAAFAGLVSVPIFRWLRRPKAP